MYINTENSPDSEILTPEIEESVDEKIGSSADTVDLTDTDSAHEQPATDENSEDEEGEDGADDLAELKLRFPELKNKNIEALPFAQRYRELRALGLTPEESYLACAGRKIIDTRAHLTDSYPKCSSAPTSSMTRGELRAARELFSGLDDSEIVRLYKRVTK